VATLKIRLAKRQSQHSIPPLNLEEELKEEKAAQFAAEAETGLRHWRLHRMRYPQKTKQSCWKWPENRLDVSSGKEKEMDI